MYNVSFTIVGGPPFQPQFLARYGGDNFSTTLYEYEAGVLPKIESFKPMIDAFRKIIEYAPTLDEAHDIWTDDRFELEFSDDPEDHSLDYTKHMRDMYEVAMLMYNYAKIHPNTKIAVQYKKLTSVVEQTSEI